MLCVHVIVHTYVCVVCTCDCMYHMLCVRVTVHTYVHTCCVYVRTYILYVICITWILSSFIPLETVHQCIPVCDAPLVCVYVCALNTVMEFI